MRSFSLVAAFAFAASVFAAPIDPPSVPAPPALPPTPLPAIINQLTSELQPLTAQLVQIVAAGNASVTALQPVTDEITSLIEGAVGQVQQLVGQPVGVILQGVESVVPISDAASLVANLLTLVITSFSSILPIVTVTEAKVVVPFLVSIGVAVGELLGVIATAVVGIVVYITPLVGDLVNTIVELNLEQIIAILGLHH